MTAQPPSPRRNDPPGHNEPEKGWAVLHNLFAALVALFGTPIALARRLTIPPAAARVFREHLRGAEALARRLLFFRAAALPMPNAPPDARPEAPGARAGKAGCGRSGFASDDAADWGISFCIVLPARRPRKAGRAQAAVAREASPYNAAPLAERLEALRRVLDDPEPYARRLAARLRAAPALIARFAANPPRMTPALERLFARIHEPAIADTG